jgi:hypothetical protein
MARSPHHPRWNWARPYRLNRDGARPPLPSSAPGLGSRTGPVPCHVCSGIELIFSITGLTPGIICAGTGFQHSNPLRAGAAHICTGTSPRLTPAASAPGLRSSIPYMPRDWAHPCHVRAGTCSSLPYLFQDWAHPATSALGLRSSIPHMPRDWAPPRHICAGTGLPPATSAPGLGPPLP